MNAIDVLRVKMTAGVRLIFWGGFHIALGRQPLREKS